MLEHPKAELSSILRGSTNSKTTITTTIATTPPTLPAELACIADVTSTTMISTVPEEDLQIGAVEEWSLVPAKKFKSSASEEAARAIMARGPLSPGSIAEASEHDSQAQEVRIQALTDASFGKVCVDYGAGESICPVDAFPSYKTVTIAKTGTTYRAA